MLIQSSPPPLIWVCVVPLPLAATVGTSSSYPPPPHPTPPPTTTTHSPPSPGPICEPQMLSSSRTCCAAQTFHCPLDTSLSRHKHEYSCADKTSHLMSKEFWNVYQRDRMGAAPKFEEFSKEMRGGGTPCPETEICWWTREDMKK